MRSVKFDDMRRVSRRAVSRCPGKRDFAGPALNGSQAWVDGNSRLVRLLNMTCELGQDRSRARQMRQLRERADVGADMISDERSGSRLGENAGGSKKSGIVFLQ